MDQRRRRVCATGLAVLASAWLGRAGAQMKPGKPGPAAAREIAIEARKFSYTPNRIALKAGESAVLVFTAIDFVHGFNVPDLHVRADLLPGQQVRVPLRFATAGDYDFLCDNFCGSGHEGMNGKFVVTT
jgi:cytochrome c oxidase subunit 2